MFLFQLQMATQRVQNCRLEFTLDQNKLDFDKSSMQPPNPHKVEVHVFSYIHMSDLQASALFYYKSKECQSLRVKVRLVIILYTYGPSYTRNCSFSSFNFAKYALNTKDWGRITAETSYRYLFNRRKGLDLLSMHRIGLGHIFRSKCGPSVDLHLTRENFIW